MRIGIISDTHLSKDIFKMENLLKNQLKDVDMVIHAGDYKNAKVIQVIEAQKRFAGVWGNNDGDSIKAKVKEKEILKINGYTIGIFHGHGGSKSTIDRSYEVFKEDKVDIIIFGHSHQPIIKTLGRVLMINPGSPTSKRKERWYSIVILQLEKDYVNATINFFNKL